jgi:hypothetical protein
MKKVAIVQSNYIPWKGYFDLIASVDEFIIYDEIQYTRRDWRNRNLIKTPDGLKWLTVPVRTKGKYHQKIRETEIDGNDWAQLHWKSISQNYCRAPHFEEIALWIKPLYINETYLNISQLNQMFISAICNYLGIHTRITNSWDYQLVGGRTERLADLCIQVNGSEYISGPSAKDYINEMIFSNSGIKLTWYDYYGYPEYPQLWGKFEHGVTILDLLFNSGKNAPRYIRHLR